MIIGGTAFSTNVTRQERNKSCTTTTKKGTKNCNYCRWRQEIFFPRYVSTNFLYVTTFPFLSYQHPSQVFRYFSFVVHRSRPGRWGTVQKEKKPKEKYMQYIKVWEKDKEKKIGMGKKKRGLCRFLFTRKQRLCSHRNRWKYKQQTQEIDRVRVILCPWVFNSTKTVFDIKRMEYLKRFFKYFYGKKIQCWRWWNIDTFHHHL